MLRQTEAGYAQVMRSSARDDFFTGYEVFRAKVLQAHRTLFSAEPSIAGRFRTQGELGEVDLHAHHFFGTAPEKIELELAALWKRLFASVEAAPKVEWAATWGARMLEGFFRIHPFVDGNGRIGRLILDVTARSVGFRLRDRGRAADDHEDYVDALRHAHRFSDESNSYFEPQERARAFVPLTDWLLANLVQVDEPSEAAPPEWIRAQRADDE